MNNIQKKYLLYIFLISFSIRLIFWFFIAHHPERAFDIDSLGYNQLAVSLLDSHVFPSIVRTPAYPFFIATVYSVFGKFPQAVLMVQYFLDSLTALFIISIFLRIFENPRYSYIAGVMYAINPFAIFYSNMILTETLFTFILTLSIYLFILFLYNHHKRYLISSSFLLGIGTLCRPIAQFVPLLLIPFIFFVKGYRVRDKLISCLIFLMIFYSALLPWYMRNYQYYGRLTLSTISDLNIFLTFAPEVLMIKSDPTSTIAYETKETIKPFRNELWNNAKRKYGWSDNKPQTVFEDPIRSSILKEEGLQIVKKHLHIFFISHAVNTGRTLLPYCPYFYKLIGKDVRIVSILSFVVDYFIMVFSAIGIVFSLKKKGNGTYHRAIAFSFVLLIFYFSFIPGIEGYSRFRIPILPYISIFAALGIWGIGTLYKSKKKLDIHAQ
jgi:4-amino-4-deoxy-L-arabinose transferase-like glycosyltransferase